MNSKETPLTRTWAAWIEILQTDLLLRNGAFGGARSKQNAENRVTNAKGKAHRFFGEWIAGD